jgi:ketosteroid isomerase-like protein
MASKNVDLVRSIRAAMERGDFTAAEWADPEIEWIFADGPNPGRWTGVAGMTESLRNFLSAWEGFHSVADEYRELDDERVLVLTMYRGRGKKSGLELEQMGAKGAALYSIRGGKVTRLVFYFDRERAFADLGITQTELSSP